MHDDIAQQCRGNIEQADIGLPLDAVRERASDQLQKRRMLEEAFRDDFSHRSPFLFTVEAPPRQDERGNLVRANLRRGLHVAFSLLAMLIRGDAEVTRDQSARFGCVAEETGHRLAADGANHQGLRARSDADGRGNVPGLALLVELEQPQIEPRRRVRLRVEPGEQRAGVAAVPQAGFTRYAHEIF